MSVNFMDYHQSLKFFINCLAVWLARSVPSEANYTDRGSDMVQSTLGVSENCIVLDFYWQEEYEITVTIR